MPKKQFSLFQPVSTLALVLLGWRLFGILIAAAAQRLLPYKGFFSYGWTILPYRVPNIVRALTNFDGIFYIKISHMGYLNTEQAFFPLYPLLISVLNSLVKNPVVAGLIISHIAFGLGFLLFRQYLLSFVKTSIANWALLFLLLYPTAYYFGVMYTESLFFFLFMGALYCLQTRRYWAAMMFAYLLSLTKVTGVLFTLPVMIYFLVDCYKAYGAVSVKSLLAHLMKGWRIVVVGIASLLGLASYALYLLRTTGDALYFINAQESFGAHRSSTLISPLQVLYRYSKIFTTADWSFQYVVAIGEVFFYISTLSLIGVEIYRLMQALKKKKPIIPQRWSLVLISAANVLVPSLTGTLTAIPRYSLLSLSIFLVLAEISDTRMKMMVLFFSLVLHVCYLALFIQGYYVT